MTTFKPLRGAHDRRMSKADIEALMARMVAMADAPDGATLSAWAAKLQPTIDVDLSSKRMERLGRKLLQAGRLVSALPPWGIDRGRRYFVNDAQCAAWLAACRQGGGSLASVRRLKRQGTFVAPAVAAGRATYLPVISSDVSDVRYQVDRARFAGGEFTRAGLGQYTAPASGWVKAALR